jgi:hypothetical protein
MFNIALLADKRQKNKVTFSGQIGPLPGILFFRSYLALQAKVSTWGSQFCCIFPSEITLHSAQYPSPIILLLRHTRIGKGAMKKFGIGSQWQREFFLIVILHFQ